MKNQELIDRLIADTKKVSQSISDIRDEERDLLLKKPGADRWSALECIEHMNISNAHYLAYIDLNIEQMSKSESGIFNAGWLGNLSVRSMKPREDGTIPNKTRTFARFQPVIDVQYDTISKFLEDQQWMTDLMERSLELDLSANKVPTSLGRLIKMRLGDTYRFLVAHNQRHVIQMNQALALAKNELVS